MTTGFFSWRWAPAVLLVLGSTGVAIAAVVFIPSSIGAPVTSRARVPVSQASDGAPRVSELEVDPAVAPSESPRRPAKRQDDSMRDPGVQSFFPAVPQAELPPPLPDDPVPPEPLEAPGNRDAFGPGVEKASIPAP